MPTEIESFFDSYIGGYAERDPLKMASHFTIPSVVLDATGIGNFLEFDQVEAKMNTYCERLKQLGYVGATYDCVNYIALGEAACFVDLLWKVDLSGSSYEYKTAYVLHKVEDAWKISNSTVYDF